MKFHEIFCEIQEYSSIVVILRRFSSIGGSVMRMDFFKTAFLKDAGAIKLTIYNNHQSTFFFVKMFFHRQTFVLLYIVSKVAPLYIVYI